MKCFRGGGNWNRPSKRGLLRLTNDTYVNYSNTQVGRLHVIKARSNVGLV